MTQHEPLTLRPAVFTMDIFELALAGVPRQFAGFTRGETWNGWACPYFTYEQARELVAGWRRMGASAGYDPGADEFYFAGLDDPTAEVERYAAVEMDGRRLYPIGAFGWIWDESGSVENNLLVSHTEGHEDR